MPALLCDALAPQPCGHHSLGEALFSRASGRRLHVVAGLVLRGPSLPESSFGGRSSFKLISVVLVVNTHRGET